MEYLRQMVYAEQKQSHYQSTNSLCLTMFIIFICYTYSVTVTMPEALYTLSNLLAYCEDQDKINATFYTLENLAESKNYFF